MEEQAKFSWWLWTYRASIALFIVLAIISQLEHLSGFVSDWWHPKIKISVINIRGSINSSSATLGQLRNALDDRAVRGVLLVIDSQGGCSASCELIFREVMRLRSHGKPVFALIEGLCVSGAYLVACASDKIFCQRSSIVGGVAVCEVAGKMCSVMDSWAKEREHSAKVGCNSGSHYDLHKPSLEQIIVAANESFVESVAHMRGLDLADQDVWAGGKLFSGDRAVELRLVDDNAGFGLVEKQFRFLLHVPDDIGFFWAYKTKFSGLARLFQGGDDEDNNPAAAESVDTWPKKALSSVSDALAKEGVVKAMLLPI